MINHNSEKYTSSYCGIPVNNNVIQDAKNIANGAYAPLTGFLRREDFNSVLNRTRLANNEIWSIPIVLDINEEDYEKIKNSETILLTDRNNEPRIILKNIEIYRYNKDEYAKKVFGTNDINHPGVTEVMGKEEYLVGGDIQCIENDEKIFPKYNLTPMETREVFKQKEWNTVVAFQTRNVPHRSHEHLQKLALNEVDGLFVQPVIGKKKTGDFKDELILKGYEVLLENYYPDGKYHLGILPIKMNYAGPKEAIIHALIRKNYGCTHIIIGRDHAGVGNYYDSYAAQEIFDQFDPEELGIKILKYENVSHCGACGKLITSGACEHGDERKEFLSGTKIREMVKNKQSLPPKFIRPEISDLLLNHEDPFVK